MWHLHMLWMALCGIIVIIILMFLFRKQIYLRMHGMKSSMESMCLLWRHNGANKEKLDDVLSKIYYMEGIKKNCWVFEFSNIAKLFYKKQILMQLDKDKNTNSNQNLLQQIYYQSSLWFGIAKYPHFNNNEIKKECYKLSKLCYIRAMKMNTNLLKFEVINFKSYPPNKYAINGYLYKSTISTKGDNAFIIIIGSIDIWKTDLWFIIKPLLENNISVFAMDLAGTGSNGYTLDQNTMYIYQDTIRWFKKANKTNNYQLNMDNFGIFGVGFGGYFAVKLAQYDAANNYNDIKFIVNLSVPLIYTFTKKWVFQMDANMINACCIALNIKKSNKYHLFHAFKEWIISNYNDESLGKCKILNIFGGMDKFINPLDGNVLINEENKIYFPNDGYCCTKNIKQWLSNTIQWINNI